MGIKFGNKEINDLFLSSSSIDSLWIGTKKIWEKVRELFGLYNSGGTQIKTWTKLVNEGLISVSDNVVIGGNFDYYSHSSCTLYGNDSISKISNFSSCLLSSIRFDGCTEIGADAFNMAAISNMSFPLCTIVGSNAFYQCANLKEVNLPECTLISQNAFCNCIKVSSISLPNVSSIGYSAFWKVGMGCSSSYVTLYAPKCTYVGNAAFSTANALGISNVDLPLCSYIGQEAFVGNAVNSLNIPMCSQIGSGAFAGCNVSSLNFDTRVNIDNNAFQSCSSLTTIQGKLNFVNDRAFADCVNLSSVNITNDAYVELRGAFPNCSTLNWVSIAVSNYLSLILYGSVFSLISSVSGYLSLRLSLNSISWNNYLQWSQAFTNRSVALSLPNCSYLGSSAFSDFSALKILYLPYSSVVELGKSCSYVFSGAGITSTTGSIYVPENLYASYKTPFGNKWSYFRTRFVSY